MTNRQYKTIVIALAIIIVLSLFIIIERKRIGQKLQALTGINPFIDYMNANIKNNNPLNIRHNASFNWVGENANVVAPNFAQFDTIENGIRAAITNLHTYVTRDGANTIEKIVARWAPPSDNNDDASYVDVVMSQLNETYPDLTSTTILDGNYQQLALIAWAMSAVEQGFKNQPAKQLFINVQQQYF